MVIRQRGRAGPSDVTHLTSHLSNRSFTRFGHFLSPERMDCWGFVHLLHGTQPSCLGSNYQFPEPPGFEEAGPGQHSQGCPCPREHENPKMAARGKSLYNI